jgi:hypothetical protein
MNKNLEEVQRCCPKCKNIDHFRSSNKLCPFYTGGRASKNTHPEGVKTSTTVIKMSLKQFCRDNDVCLAIDDVCDRMTRTTYEMSLLANLFIYDLIQKNETIPKIDTQFCSDLIQTVCNNSKCKNTQLNDFKEIYMKLRSKFTKHTCNYTSQVITSSATQYATNCMNHVTTNIHNRTLRYIKYSVRGLDKIVPAAVKHHTADLIYKKFVDGNTNLEKLHEKIQTLKDPSKQKECFDIIKSSYDEIESMLQGLSLEPEAIKEYWWNYIPFLHRILVKIDAIKNAFVYKPDDEQKPKNKNKKSKKIKNTNKAIIQKLSTNYKNVTHVRKSRKHKNKHKKLVESPEKKVKNHDAELKYLKIIKRFDILPIYSFQTRHITIDTTALFFILTKDPFLDMKEYTDLINFRKNGKEIWERFFKVKQFETKNRIFTRTIMTDGHVVSILLKKPNTFVEKIVKNDVDEYAGLDKELLPESVYKYGRIDLTKTRIVGVDPGRRDLFTSIDEKGNVMKCSTKEYYYLAGFNKRRLDRERKLKRSEVQNIQTNLPSSRTSDLNQFKFYMMYVFTYYEDLFGFYEKKFFRRSRFNNYSGKQRTIKKLCDWIIDDPGPEPGPKKETIVAFGHAPFCSSSAGYSAGPIKLLNRELGKRCKRIVVNEAYTSITCSTCLKRFDKAHKRFYGLQQCLNCSKSTLWNRDVNAARNMITILKYMIINNGDRHPSYNKPLA